MLFEFMVKFLQPCQGKGNALGERERLGYVGIRDGPLPGYLSKGTHPWTPLLSCRVTAG